MADLVGERFLLRNGNVEKPVRRTQGTGAHEDDDIAGFAVHLQRDRVLSMNKFCPSILTDRMGRDKFLEAKNKNVSISNSRALAVEL